MKDCPDSLTLEALLADPLTRLVMRSDNVTVHETAQAFAQAGAAVLRNRVMQRAVPPLPWRRTGRAECRRV